MHNLISLCYTLNQTIGTLYLPPVLKKFSFEFIFEIKGSKLDMTCEGILNLVNEAQNKRQFLVFTIGWGNEGVNSPWLR